MKYWHGFGFGFGFVPATNFSMLPFRLIQRDNHHGRSPYQPKEQGDGSLDLDGSTDVRTGFGTIGRIDAGNGMRQSALLAGAYQTAQWLPLVGFGVGTEAKAPMFANAAGYWGESAAVGTAFTGSTLHAAETSTSIIDNDDVEALDMRLRPLHLKTPWIDRPIILALPAALTTTLQGNYSSGD